MTSNMNGLETDMTDHHRPQYPVDYQIPDTHLARAKREADRRKAWGAAYDRFIHSVLVMLFVAAGLYIFARVVAGV
jgi:hypothetical protein